MSASFSSSSFWVHHGIRGLLTIFRIDEFNFRNTLPLHFLWNISACKCYDNTHCRQYHNCETNPKYCSRNFSCIFNSIIHPDELLLRSNGSYQGPIALFKLNKLLSIINLLISGDGICGINCVGILIRIVFWSQASQLLSDSS